MKLILRSFPHFFWCILLFACNFFITEGTAAERKEFLIDEAWSHVMKDGVKVGHAHSIEKSIIPGDGRKELIWETFLVMKRKILMFESTVEARSRSVVDEELRPLSYEQEMKVGEVTQRFSASFTTDEIIFRTVTAGGEQVTRFPRRGDELLPDVLERVVAMKGLETGKEFSFTIFDPELGGTDSIKIKVARKKDYFYLGKKIDAYELDIFREKIPMLRSTVTASPEGKSYMIEIPAVGMKVIRTTREEALDERKTESLDVLPAVLVKDTVENPVGLKSMTVRLTSEDPALLETVASDELQRVLRHSANSVTVKTFSPPVSTADSLDIPITGYDEYRKPNIFEQSDSPDIISKAKEIAGSRKNALDIVLELLTWVSTAIKPDEYETDFGSALDTLKSGHGDCTEHTVLFNALARALGIPARTCQGLVYTEGRAFILHVWSQVMIGKKWVDVDPTFNQIPVDATHIKLWMGILGDQETLWKLKLKNAYLARKVKMEILELERSGGGSSQKMKSVVSSRSDGGGRKDSVTAPSQADDTLYVSREYGISLKAPAGWYRTVSPGNVGERDSYLLVAFTDGTSAGDGPGVTFGLFRETLEIKLDSRAYMQRVIDTYKSMSDSFRAEVLCREKNARDAFRLEFMSADGSVYACIVALTKGETGFLLTGFFPTVEKNFYIDLFDDFVRTFKFLEESR